ncbi:MAG: carboxypeptidase-like regulatory domain-containing protein, partial [Rhodothermales bacterium]|nr:carboxypeptidase-like regulatory domain-containing protein [Rhodothermales bacterium]
MYIVPHHHPFHPTLKRFISSACVVAAVWTSISFLSSPVAAQGLVTGTVVDGPTGKPVEGVTVVLAGTLFGTVTGPDGSFSLGPVSNGTYTLKLIRAGYEPVEVEAAVPGSRVLVELGKERSPLNSDPLGGISTAFDLGAYQDRGDP